MRYWDSSALVPLLVREAPSSSMEALVGADSSIVTWWGTSVECGSAIARREREGAGNADEVATASRKLATLESDWSEVAPSERIRSGARRLLRVHELRAGDALQLAAALAASATHDVPLPFVTLDERLALAASREGFAVLGLD